MIAFEIITFGVAAAGLALGLGPFRPSRAFDAAGRHGYTWFDHSEDLPIEHRPSEDERDAPIPRRPLRSRSR